MSSRLLRSSVLSVVFLVVAAQAVQAATPRRIVALTPFAANTMALLGVGPVAVGQVASGTDLYDRRLAAVPRLTLTHPAGPNLEQLATLRADFVFTTGAWSRGTAGMKRLGMRVADREPNSVAEVPKQTARIGAILGRRSAGRSFAAVQASQIASASRGIKTRPRVLMVLGVGSTAYAFLPNSWGGDLLRQAGGRLITGSLSAPGGYARISDEFVVAQNPDVIIAVPHGAPSNIGKIAGQLRARPGWRTTKAVRTGRLYISTSNTLLQPISGVASTITSVRRSYLGN